MPSIVSLPRLNGRASIELTLREKGENAPHAKMKCPLPNVLFEMRSAAEADLAALHPDEQKIAASILNATARLDFISGRLAARSLMTRLGVPEDTPLLRADSGEPLWPGGITGSISHNAGTAVVIAAPAAEARSVGVDLEELKRKIREGTERRVALPPEVAWIEENPSERDIRLLTIFSAKEAVFKALSMLGSGVFWFEKVELTPLPDEGIPARRFASNIDRQILKKCGVKAGPTVFIEQDNAFLASFVLIQ